MAAQNREHDPLIDAYKHLDKMPRAAEALQMLKKVASLVKPIMRKRMWRVGTLSEFFPSENNVLGKYSINPPRLNIDYGKEICLRLRYPGDYNQFMPLENIIDTMLHELSHIVRGPHDKIFHKLWNELRDEYEGLKMKGYSGEGFLGNGQRLGGRSVPIQEWRRQARVEAERRRKLEQQMQPGGHRLGGSLVPRGVDMRQVIADAAEKRGKRTRGITEGCASGTKDAEKLREQASKNGSRTKAEEDEANDRAIAQALWELVQEEENENAGIEGTSLIAEPSGGLQWTLMGNLQGVSDRSVPQTYRSNDASTNIQPAIPSIPVQSRPNQNQTRSSPALNPHGRPISRLITEAEAKQRQARRSKPSKASTGSKDDPVNIETDDMAPMETEGWSCAICTLKNPDSFLACDACGVERTPDAESITISSPGSSKAVPAKARTPKPTYSAFESASKRLGWNCRQCGTFMESQWWTCSFCGLMKNSS